METFFKGSINCWQDEVNGYAREEKGSKHCPVELVEKQKVGLAFQNQASLRKANEDHPEQEAEEESVDVATNHDYMANLDDHTAVESLSAIIK